MLVAMLRASGIEANPAFVFRGLESPKILLSSVIPTNHAIVRVKLDNKIWWLDPTNSAFLPDYIPLDIHNRWAVVFRPNHQIEWDHIPREDSQSPVIIETTTLEYDDKGHTQKDRQRAYFRSGAIGWVSDDYFQGSNAIDRLYCNTHEANLKPIDIKRENTDFLASEPYLVEHVCRSKTPILETTHTQYRIAHFALGELDNLKHVLQHYLSHQSQSDLDMSAYSSSKFYTLFRKHALLFSFKPHTIQSPWFDISLNWYDSKEEEGCVCEVHFIRKVDWLGHCTITSPEFKQFLEQIEAIQNEMSQLTVYSNSLILRKFCTIPIKHPILFGASSGLLAGALAQIIQYLTQ
jgi:hypothetical protein